MSPLVVITPLEEHTIIVIQLTHNVFGHFNTLTVYLLLVAARAKGLHFSSTPLSITHYRVITPRCISSWILKGTSLSPTVLLQANQCTRAGPVLAMHACSAAAEVFTSPNCLR